MTEADLQKRLRQVTWPEPSPELLAQILSNASTVERSVTWSDRVWFSPQWRLAGLAATLGLVATIIVLGTHDVDADPSSKAVAARAFVEETIREAGFTSDEAAAVARRALVAPRSTTALMQELTIELLESRGNHQ